MKKIFALSCLLLSLAFLSLPGVASAASGGQGPGGGTSGGSGNSGASALNVAFSFSPTQLTCNQDNDVALTVTNQGSSGTVMGVAMGFESQYNPEIKSPAQGQDGIWNVSYLTDSGYTGLTYDTTAANGIGPGQNTTVSTRVYVPCGPTEIKVLGAAGSNPKSMPATTFTTFKMVSGVSVTSLPKTGAETNAFSLVLLGLPALLGLRKFIK